VTAYRVLVVEDDHGLRDVLARGLREEGFEVTTASDGRSAIRASASTVPDVIVLDIGLPDSDGRDVCQAIRSRGVDSPVIFLTARDGLTDVLSGFAVGADDYLAKPFAFPELIARVTAVARRGGSPSLGWGDLELDPTTHSLTSAGNKVALSPTEFRLLARLLSAPEKVIRRRQLVAAAWPDGAIVSDNTLDQYVSKLRRKLAEVGSIRMIEAARGVGFRLA